MKAAGPSAEPAPEMFTGSQPSCSELFSQVIVPPGWMSLLGAVVGAEVTLVSPPVGAWFTAFFGAVVAVLRRTVVAVAFAVVAVTPVAGFVVEGAAPAAPSTGGGGLRRRGGDSVRCFGGGGAGAGRPLTGGGGPPIVSAPLCRGRGVRPGRPLLRAPTAAGGDHQPECGDYHRGPQPV